MATPTSHDGADHAPRERGLLDQISGIDEKLLRQFQALCKGAQMQALMSRSPRLADWFQTIALIILDERHRRVGKDLRIGDPDERLQQHTLALSQLDLEAVAMGFARMIEKASPEAAERSGPLIDIFYEPVRIELMQRLSTIEQQ